MLHNFIQGHKHSWYFGRFHCSVSNPCGRDCLDAHQIHFRFLRVHRQIRSPRLPCNEVVSSYVWNVSRSDLCPLQAKAIKNGCVPRHIVIKMMKIKDKDKILKATRDKQQITYKGTPTRLSADFSPQKHYKPEGNGMLYLKWQKGRNCNQEHSTQ